MNKNPVFHFLIFGFLLAIVFLFVAGLPADGEANRRILITDAVVTQLRAVHYRQWKRDPTPEELRGLVDRYVREEVLYREALARGLDENDMTVRRAMAQKMEFIGSSQSLGEDPTDEEVEAYFSLRKDRYRQSGAASFYQIYFSADNGNSAKAIERAEALKNQLAGQDPDGLDLEALGDPLMLDARYKGKGERQIASLFGNNFAESVMALPSGEWAGPVESGYGQHLVFISEREDASIPYWREVETAIRQDMEREAAEASRELFYTEILRNFEVVYMNETAGTEEEGAE